MCLYLVKCVRDLYTDNDNNLLFGTLHYQFNKRDTVDSVLTPIPYLVRLYQIHFFYNWHWKSC